MRERRVFFGACFSDPSRVAPCDRMLAGPGPLWSGRVPGSDSRGTRVTSARVSFFLAKGDNCQRRAPSLLRRRCRWCAG